MQSMKEVNLICTKCNKKFPIDQAHFRCDICNEPLELEEIKEGRIRKDNVFNQTIIERYADFFPFLDIDEDLSLGEGFTGLVESNKIAREIGIENLYFKNETQNPTWSFKDRGTIAGIQHAVKLGYKTIGTVSTGNMASSVAAYGAKANLKTYIFVYKDIADEKLNPIAIYNPRLIKVDGDYGKLYLESFKIGEENNIYFINSDVPFRIEGYKTIAFEICEQLDFDIPDYIVVPTSAGGDIRGIEKGFREFKNCGLIDKTPKIICAQASGCSPIYTAYKEKSDTVIKYENPSTIAHAIGNPTPPSGNQVLRMINWNRGTCVAVSDEEIIEAQGMLARTGIFGQPASAVPLAAVKKLREEDYIKKEERAVCIVTSTGLKYTAAFKKHNLRFEECNIKDLSKIVK